MHPPRFSDARNLRQRARSAGLNPNYWYVVEYDRALKPGKVIEVKFWNRSIALFRGKDGQIGAIENRCAHRQIKLSLGEVQECSLVCPYHGWTYNREGRVTAIPHELFGRAMPNFRVPSFPVKVRYGLIWIFPGDPALAEQSPIPEIPELEGEDRWASIPFDFTWGAHHSMIVDNLSDLTHGYLHRKYKPFSDPVLTSYEARGDGVHCVYETSLLEQPVMRGLVDRTEKKSNIIELCFEYPYHWGYEGVNVRHWFFLLPIDEQTTRVFFVFYFNRLQVPFTRWAFPRALMMLVIRLANPFYIMPLVSQDGDAVEYEQKGYHRHFDAPLAEMNPAVPLFQQLIVRKWDEYLASCRKGHAIGETR